MSKQTKGRSDGKPRAVVIDVQARAAAADLSLSYDPGGMFHDIARKPPVGNKARADFDRLFEHADVPTQPVAADLTR